MKAMTLIALILVLSVPVSVGAAETDAAALDTLVVDLWPDYDEASVLVLLTGTLSGTTPLPARITLPLPESARINAVARIDSRDGAMKDDILASPGLGELTLITPDPTFRVEYYLPYTVKDKLRAFDFTWQARLSVAQFRLRVQQPAAAKSFRTVPVATDGFRDEKGLNYLSFPVKAIPAGQKFKLHVDYNMDLPTLTVQTLPPDNPSPPSSAPPAPRPVDSGANWPLMAIVVGGVLVVLAGIWMIVTRRSGASGNRRQ